MIDQSMVNRNKAKGTAHETATVRYLQENGFPKAERRALAGNSDKGDIVNIPAVIECKNAQRIELSTWCDEADVERINAGERFGILVIKRRNKGINKAYAVVPLSQMVELLNEVINK